MENWSEYYIYFLKQVEKKQEKKPKHVLLSGRMNE